VREKETDGAISKRLGRHHNWLTRLKTKTPELYNQMFSFHENRNRSIRLYNEHLKSQQELINSFRNTILFKEILSSMLDKKTMYMFTQTLDRFLNKEGYLITSDPRTLKNINTMVDIYIETIEEHIGYVKKYKGELSND